MKIKKIEAKSIRLELLAPIEIALGRITHQETVIVRLKTDTGLTGYGEGCGMPFVTGETPESILKAISLFDRRLKDKEVFAIEEIHSDMDGAVQGNPGAKAAVDMALYDVMAQQAGLPLYQFLGGTQAVLETDATIGIAPPDVMAQQAQSLWEKGFRQLKIKAGLDAAQDIQAIQKIRRVIGPEGHLKVDANQGWAEKETLLVLKETEQQIHILEQPCRADQQGALRRLRARTTVEIMADESCFSLHDAWQLACQEAVDGFNIKLMKCGGIFRALQIHTIAQTAGISCMIGCMMESPVGISAAAAVASACKNITYCDLDSFLCLKDNPNLQGGFTWAEPLICLEGGPGLGVRVNFDQLS